MTSNTDPGINILTWNVENLFHPETGGPRYDFTPAEGWTQERYESKVARVAATLRTIIGSRGVVGAPWILGLTEVESDAVGEHIAAQLPPGFGIARDPEFLHAYHDTVLLFDETALTLLRCTHHETFLRFDKGDVLQADFRHNASGRTLTVLLCHLKARPSNRYHTSTYRQAAADNLQTLVWRMHGGAEMRECAKRIKGEDADRSGLRLELNQNVVIMGDFNDEPFSPSMTDYLLATYDQDFVKNQKSIDKVVLYNAAWERLGRPRPGSLHYEGSPTSSWSMLDQIVLTPALLTGVAGLQYAPASFEVIQDLTADDNGRPLSCQTRDENWEIVWRDGFSDHFPVIARISVS